MAAAPVFLFRSHFQVRGSSMAPTLRDGDLVHIVPRRWHKRSFARGALVVVAPQDGSDRILVKRVIGLPGEHVRVDSRGAVAINDIPLQESYAIAGETPQYRQTGNRSASQWLCDNDEYFLMGDNRANSGDSRHYGPASHASIIGRVWLRWRWQLGSA